MNWNEYTIKTTTAAEGLMCQMLMEAGVEGVVILDNIPLTKQERELMYIDIEPTLPPDKGDAFLQFYLQADRDDLETLMEIHGFETLEQCLFTLRSNPFDFIQYRIGLCFGTTFLMLGEDKTMHFILHACQEIEGLNGIF